MKRPSRRGSTRPASPCPSSWLRGPSLLGIAVVILALGGCHRPGKQGGAEAAEDEKEPSVTVPVRVAAASIGIIDASVTASGVVTALPDREADVDPATSGRITAVLAHQGDVVRRGQALVLLDASRLEALARQADAAVGAARRQEAQAALDVLSQEQTYRSNVLQAEAGVRSAQLALDKLLAGSRPQEIAQAQAAVDQAQATLGNAKATRDRTDYLFRRGIAAKREVDDADTQYRIAESQVQNAQQSLDLVKAGARAQDIAAARVQVRQAEDTLTHARAGQVDTRAKQEALRALRDQVRAAAAAAAAAHADLSLATIQAPISGTVIARSVQPGATVDLASTLMTIADLSQVEFLAQIQPADLPRVHAGQSATLTVAAYPGRRWTGTVFQVSQATDPKTNTVPARIRFNNPGGRLKAQMYGTVQLQRTQHRALLVPKSAVLVDEGGHYVFVVDPKSIAHRRTVQVGLVDADRQEIVRGIQAGDRVVVTGNYGLPDGAKVAVGS